MNRAFTLLELVLVILLLSTLSLLFVPRVNVINDAQRYETTRAKMEAIRVAILGNPAMEQEVSRFGYLGDMGKMPDALTDLVNSEVPLFAFNATYGFGSGWRGPYFTAEFSGAPTISKDAWGRDFIYDTVSNPPVLKSYGADGLAGGSGLNQDLVMSFLTGIRLARVQGILADAESRLSGRTVEIRYPVAGTLTAFTTVTDADGVFSFSSVPFGVRSLAVTSAPVLSARPFVVKGSEVILPAHTLNYNGSLQAVTLEAGSVTVSGPGSSYVTLNLSSSYLTLVQLKSLAGTWSKPNAYLKQVAFAAQVQDLPNLPSGLQFNVEKTLTLPASSTGNSLELRFAKNPDGTGNANMTTETIHLNFEWINLRNHDSVTFSTP